MDDGDDLDRLFFGIRPEAMKAMRSTHSSIATHFRPKDAEKIEYEGVKKCIFPDIVCPFKCV
jgi:hypothetical protein